MSKTLITSRDPKGLHAVGLFEAIYNKAGLNDARAQRLNERGGELQDGIAKLIAELTTSNQYAGEEVESSYGYLSGYTRPVGITDQIDILRSHWPLLNPDAALRYCREVYPTLQYPSWVEGPFALIRPGFFSDKYGEELEEVLRVIRKGRKGKFYNYREGCLGEQHLRQTNHTLTKMCHLVERQAGSDILIVGEQFGIRHRGRSVRRSRAMFIAGEYGEGAKNVGTMILTNPVRLQHLNDLWIDCAGDEHSPEADGCFVYAPSFVFDDDGVWFNTDGVDVYSAYCGSASGFLPQ